ncbi:gephyrin-like molybdotransferase Glp [Gemmatimonas sp.]|uniref:molybdopterin molybdotransferase MoeA n=1 Tax=Gemmatimonas sp. TaxID=1962908 RepID=UPI003982DB61
MTHAFTNAFTPGDRLPLSFDEALDAILLQADGRTTTPEWVALAQSLGRALSAPVHSRVALPPWDNAGMDGYAVQRADIIGATRASPRLLPVLGMSAAGADPTALPWVQQGTALRIMTGAPMPPGADAVIRIEDTDEGIAQVAVFDDRDGNGRANVRPRGEDVAAGSTLFARGTTIGASHLGVLASIGAHSVSAYRAPRVTIVSSGDELVMLDRFDEVEAGQRIVSSTSYALPALLRSAGADVRTLPLVPDTLRALTTALAGALDEGCDLLITTGGVSVGAHDYTRDALSALGGRQTFWRARIRPGGPIGTGMVRDVPWIGLPGNPVSTMVTGSLFAWPLIRVLGGHTGCRPLRVPVRFLDSADTPAALTHFLRVVVSAGADGTPEARLAGPQGSNLLRTMALANALLMIPPEVSRANAGTLFTAILLPDVPLMTT